MLMSRVKYLMLLASIGCGIWVGNHRNIPGKLSRGPVHRYSFSELATNEANGLEVSDSVGYANGVVKGLGSKFLGGRLILPGGNPDVAPYVELPSGILSINSTNHGGTGEFSIEGWVRITGNQTWSRIFDFGCTGSSGHPSRKIFGPGGTEQGLDYLAYAAQIGDQPNTRRLELRDEDPAGGGAAIQDILLAKAMNTDRHFVVTWQESTGEIKAYENGMQVALMKAICAMSDVNDINNWLGRSQWHDMNFQGELDEVRIYDHVLTFGEVKFNEMDGPDKLVAPPPTLSEVNVRVNPGKAALVSAFRKPYRFKHDSFSVKIVDPPTNGTAQVKADGEVLYVHNGGTNNIDRFSYNLKDSFGNLSPPIKVVLTITDSLRLPNQTLNIPQVAPLAPYQIVDAFPGLKFKNPLALRSLPGDSKRLFVVERSGIVSYIPDVTTSNTERRIFLNIMDRIAFDDSPLGELGLQSIAFHPGFVTNGEFFVFYNAPGDPYFNRVSRFELFKDSGGTPILNPLRADPSSERILINTRHLEFNHNAGDLQFGSDGYLYIALGDDGGVLNAHERAQRIDNDLFSGIARIDVDKRPGSYEPDSHAAVDRDNLGRAFYSIPPDNPFVGATHFNGLPVKPEEVRGEFWAVGLRNPWRINFDRDTGELWTGDVGQASFEEVDIITKGGNYGWAFREGAHQTPGTPSLHVPDMPKGFVSIDPIWEYPHTGNSTSADYSGNSVIGGVIYHGNRLPELANTYIFGDFVSGNIWTLNRLTNAVSVKRVAGEGGIAAYGEDPNNGDVLLASYVENKIKRLVRTNISNQDFPTRLSDTGVFADLATLTPNSGIVSYEPNVAFWSDYAIKRRWFAIPNPNKVIKFNNDGDWVFPSGMVWIKHFDLEIERGNPRSKRRIETRILVKTDTGVFGVSYKWNDEQTDATLVEDSGQVFPLAITINGQHAEQMWEIPSRANCLSCHTQVAGYALSFNTRQLNGNARMNDRFGNQISILSDAGYFSNRIGDVHELPSYVGMQATNGGVEAKVLSYLAVNCSQCHQPGGVAPETWNARAGLTMVETKLINGRAKNDGGDPSNRLVVPADPKHSLLLQRLQIDGRFSRMPPLGTHQVDESAITLIKSWISESKPSVNAGGRSTEVREEALNN